jgi:hypothetical protein
VLRATETQARCDAEREEKEPRKKNRKLQTARKTEEQKPKTKFFQRRSEAV